MGGVTPAAFWWVMHRMAAEHERGHEHHAPRTPHWPRVCPTTGQAFSGRPVRAAASPHKPRRRAGAACDTMIEGSPQAVTKTDQRTRDEDGRACSGAHPYSNRVALSWGAAATSARASASVVIGTSAAAWSTLISDSVQKPATGSSPRAKRARDTSC